MCGQFASDRKILNKVAPHSLSLFFGSLNCDMFSKGSIKQLRLGTGTGGLLCWGMSGLFLERLDLALVKAI